MYVTERAIFKLVQEGLMLIEIAPGVRMKEDVLDMMGFKPIISEDLKEMDGNIFSDELLGLKIKF